MPCGLLGCTADQIIGIIGTIVATGGSLFTGLWSVISVIFGLFWTLISIIGAIIGIILNPYLFLMVIFTCSHFYTATVSHTRKDIIINYGKYYYYVGKGIWHALMQLYQLVIWILNTITNMIP